MSTSRLVSNPSSLAFGYRRKSTLAQSYERQSRALADAGIPETRIFEDAMSGKTMVRPGWIALVGHVREGDEVWVDGLDRLGRSTLATLQAIEELADRGVAVRSTKPGEDLGGATGELIRGLMLVMANWERRQMLERVAEARVARAAAGLPVGRPKTALTPARVKKIRALRAGGYTATQIAQDMSISRASVYRALAAEAA